MDMLSLWLLFVIVGLGTFLIRLSFIELHGSMQERLERSRNTLALLPPAILAALCIPSILFNRTTSAPNLDIDQIIAATLSVLVARYTRSVFWPILGGMVLLWGLRWLY